MRWFFTMRWIVLTSLSASLLAQSPQLGNGQNSTLKVTVVDQLGALIPKAFILVSFRCTHLGKTRSRCHWRCAQDVEGNAKTSVPFGFYDLFIASIGLLHAAKS